jgi:hypothetical protein
VVWCGRCYQHHELDRFFQHSPTDEEGFDWRPVDDKLWYCQGRDGDHLLLPFQCDLCWFHNLQGWDPLADDLKDSLLLCCICRANLDAIWGREPHTVASTLRAVKQLVRLWDQVGLSPELPALGPFPVKDSVGFRVAVGMLLKSLEPGRYNQDYQQYETIRKLRGGYSNLYMASLVGTSSLQTMGGDRIKHSDDRSHPIGLVQKVFPWVCEKDGTGRAPGLGHPPSSHACFDEPAGHRMDPSGGCGEPRVSG